MRWNVTNVTRKNRPNIYMTPEWLEKQKELGIDVSDLEGPQEEELSMQQYEDFMVWHRGLAVPAARNLDKPDVRRGQELFNKLGCAGCHKPEWTTGNISRFPVMQTRPSAPIRICCVTIWGKSTADVLVSGVRRPFGEGADAQNRQPYRYVP